MLLIKIKKILNYENVLLAIFIFLFSSNLILSIKDTLVNENFLKATLSLYLFFYIILISQFFLVVHFYKYLVNSKLLRMLFISIFLQVNFYTFYLSTSDFFIFVPYKVKLIYLLISWVIIFIFSSIFLNKKVLIIFSIIYLFLNLFFLINNQFSKSENQNFTKYQKIEISKKYNFHIF